MGESTHNVDHHTIPPTLGWSNVIRTKMAQILRTSTLHFRRDCHVRRTSEHFADTLRAIFIRHMGWTMHNDEHAPSCRWETTAPNTNSSTIPRRTRTMGSTDDATFRGVCNYTDFDPRRAVEEAITTASGRRSRTRSTS